MIFRVNPDTGRSEKVTDKDLDRFAAHCGISLEELNSRLEKDGIAVGSFSMMASDQHPVGRYKLA